MKFSEMPYERPDAEQVKADLSRLTEELKNAESYDRAKEIFLRYETLYRHIDTLSSLAYVRNTIDTRDAFYDGEMKYWNRVFP
ncbi:MAG: M3 family oligoendopeptidase, partial [Eubacteriales bacterium]